MLLLLMPSTAAMSASLSPSAATNRAQQLVQHLTGGPSPSFTVLPSSTAHIICHVYPNGLAQLILNRPKAYNALSFPMCDALLTHLRSFLSPPTSPPAVPVRLVLLTAAGPAGVFCSGGDVRAMTQLVSLPHPAPPAAAAALAHAFHFFRLEYTLNHLLASYPLPVLALMDGVTMGGGCGLVLHCSHRIATRRTVVAMPECSIGLVPDVGGTYFLARWPGWVGMWAGLTASRLDGVDAMYVGAADWYVEVEQVNGLIRDLHSAADWGSDLATVRQTVDSTLSRWQSSSWQAQRGYVEQHRDLIDRCFSQPTLHSLLTNLTTLASTPHSPVQPLTQFARHCLAQLVSKCPTSLQLTHAALWLSHSSQLSLARCLQLEHRLVVRLCLQPRGGDFAVGVLAVLVDKRREGEAVEWVSGWRSVEEVDWFMSGLDPDLESVELQLDEAESADRLAARVADQWPSTGMLIESCGRHRTRAS